jgi:hypothetical protein
MAGLAALATVISTLYLGATGASWWLVPGVAVIGSLVYAWLRAGHLALFAERGQLPALVPVIYATQLLTAAILFSIGRVAQWWL